MSDFVDKTATDEIRLISGRKVQVRQQLAAPEQAQLTRQLFRLKIDAATGSVEVTDADWHLQHVHLLKAYLVGWNLCDAAGEVVPYKSELVDMLPAETVDEIARCIDQAQAERRELAEKKGVGS